MMKLVAAITAAFLFAISPAETIAETLSPTPVFDGDTTTLAKNGAMRTVHIIVQSWEMWGRNGAMQEIPLRGFYVAHLQGDDISTTIDGQTTRRASGDYWTVKAGATMQVKVLREFTVLETTVVAKQ